MPEDGEDQWRKAVKAKPQVPVPDPLAVLASQDAADRMWAEILADYAELARTLRFVA